MIEDALYESDIPYWFYSTPLTEPGYYTAVLEGHDCDSVIGLTLMVLEGVDENAENAVQIWPNPTTGQINIDAEEPCDVEVRNVLGQLVLQATKAETIDISSLENGVYFLLVTDKNGRKCVTKIIKE